MTETKQLPTFVSQRIILRPINQIDCNDMYDYAKRENVGPNAGWMPHQSIEESEKIIFDMIKQTFTDDNIGVFSIVDKKSLKMIGTIGLHRYRADYGCVELGYVLNPDFWGNGLMVEAVIRIIPWLFDELDLYRIECNHYDFNERSKRVIEKSGFHYEGTARKKVLLKNGKRCDMLCYSLLKDEYLNKECPWQHE